MPTGETLLAALVVPCHARCSTDAHSLAGVTLSSVSPAQAAWTVWLIPPLQVCLTHDPLPSHVHLCIAMQSALDAAPGSSMEADFLQQVPCHVQAMIHEKRRPVILVEYHG